MQSVPRSGERINLFSLVAYIPDPLRIYLDCLREELVPSCQLRAHVTVLPPRPLSDNLTAASEKLRLDAREFLPFEAEVGDVEIFSLTSVIYLAVGKGFSKFRRMHDVLNSGALQFCEPYPYHPHITLAQQISPEQAPGVFEMARTRWAECPHPRRFPVDTLTFVQGASNGDWVDLEEVPVGVVAAK